MGIDVEFLYRKYGPMVLRRCRFLLRDEQKALDAAQDTFVRLLRSRDKLTDAAPSSLLYRIATNVCLNVLRAEKNRTVRDSNDVLLHIADASDHTESFLHRHILDKIFQSEKPTTREIAVMRYVDGMSLEEVAAESGLSVSGVRKRLRALKARIGAQKVVYG
ncbi:MAG: sigma-70 family RNA polymerase sigma factor [Spirochaetales bacterium]|nr:sigma-70 family RNA polymerase sigma factor [Spirochaetales bacterium]